MQRLTRNTAFAVAAVYALSGAIWILLSDRLLAMLVVDPLNVAAWQTYKGWAFVLASTFLLYFLLRRFTRTRDVADLHLQAVNRVYAVLSDVNQTIVRERDPQALFKHICAIAVERGAWRMAWIGLLDEDGHAVKPVAHAGIADGYLEGLQIVLDDASQGQGPTASALLTGQHVIVDDIEHDPRMGPWRSSALALGYRASAAFPLIVAGQARGALNLYAAETNAFDATEIALLDKMVMDIAFALEFNAQESQRRHAEQMLRDSEARYRHVSSAISDIAYACTADDAGDYAIAWMTGASESITGYALDDIIAMRCWGFLVVAEDLPLFHARVTGLAPGSADACELRLRHKDGQVIWVLSTAECVADEHAAQVHHLYGGLVDITERKKAEEALRTSEAALRRSQQVAQVGHWTWDTRSNRVAWSDEMYRIFGVERVSADVDLNGVIQQAIHPDDIQRIKAMNDAVTQEGRPQETEYRVVWPDGAIRHVWAMPADSVTDEHGAIMQLSGVVQDITERKQVEQQLHLQSAALHAAANGIVITDVDGGIEWVNPAFTALTGYSLEESRGQNPRTLVRSGVHDRAYYQMMWDTILAGKMWRGELVNRRKDGTTYIEEQTITPVHDEQGQVRHFIGIKQEITERKRAEAERERLLQQVQAQAGQMAQIMYSVPEGVLLLDAAGCIVTANPRATALLQFLAGVAIGDSLTHLGGRPLAEVLTSPPAGQWHVLEVDARCFEVIARPVETGPQLDGWVLVIRDITALRAVERQLQQQERLAAIGQLAAGIAHDFNNIMSVIVMYAQMMARAPELTERDRARLATIDEQAWRATQMIRQILDFSRRAVLERQPLNLLSLLKEQIELLERTLPEHVELEFTHEPGDYLIKGDATRIQQMAMNLAFNARDAMPLGGKLRFALAHYVVHASQDAPAPGMAAGAWLQWQVSDTGVGMSEQVLNHIFEPFFTTKEPGQGTGLGLAQVHGIVGQHDGHILVTSQEGAGTQFTIYLPALVTTAPRALETAAPVPSVRGHGETILIVEDNAALRATMVELLAAWGYQVRQATNGNEALALLLAPDAPIDLVLSDVVMPKSGGVALFKALRAHNVEKPVILLSGHPLAEEVEELRSLGLRAWLAKPPDAEELAQALAAALLG